MWTASALASELRPFAAPVWRVVESQARASTLKLVDSLEEQAVLEQELEATKPLVPEPCRGLDYLLAGPFRYAPYPHGSRFRRAHQPEGAFYAALVVETAIAETAFYALVFFRRSPEARLPGSPTEKTAFRVPVATDAAVDLTAPPLDGDDAKWTDLDDYGACQDLADAARQAGAQAIRYRSVRDPKGRHNLALLDCRAFRARKPDRWQTWHLFLRPDGVDALCELPRLALGFRLADFAADPRL